MLSDMPFTLVVSLLSAESFTRLLGCDRVWKAVLNSGKSPTELRINSTSAIYWLYDTGQVDFLTGLLHL